MILSYKIICILFRYEKFQLSIRKIYNYIIKSFFASDLKSKLKKKNCSKWCKTSLIQFISFYINNFQLFLKLRSHFVEIRTGLYNEVDNENIRIMFCFIYICIIYTERNTVRIYFGNALRILMTMKPLPSWLLRRFTDAWVWKGVMFPGFHAQPSEDRQTT